MAYIGQSIKNGTFSVLDTSGNTYNGSNTTFSLGTQVGSPAQLLVSHDGVIQKPGTDYTLATGGTQITFTTAPASGASIFIVEISGAVGGPMNTDLNGNELVLDVDGDTSITADTDDQIDIKIAGADDFKFSANAMNVLSGSTLTIDSGATIANSGTATGFGDNNAPSFFAYQSSVQSINNDSWTKINYETELLDSDGKFASHKFTPTVAGKYFLFASYRLNATQDGNEFRIAIYKNGSIIRMKTKTHDHRESVDISTIVVSDTDDYFEVYGWQNTGGGRGIYGDGDSGESDDIGFQTTFGGFRIAGT